MFRLSSENSSETVSKFYQFLTSSALVKDESDLVHTMKAWKGGGQQYSSTYSNFGTIWGG